MRAKDPHFRPNPDEPCICGTGKVQSQCCLRSDGTIYKERASIRPPGPVTGYSHPGCYLSFTENCDEKLSREHLSLGIFKQIGHIVNVTGWPGLGPGEVKQIGITGLTSKILCKRHNSGFSKVDAVASRFFEILTDIHTDARTSSLSRKKHFYLFNGEDLEMWAAKVLLDLFYSEPKASPLRDYSIDKDIVRTLFAAGRLPPDCGLYLGATLGDRITYNRKELMVGTITDPNHRRLLGLIFYIESVPFEFLIDNSGLSISAEIRATRYRLPHITFEGRGRSHTICFSWPANPNNRGLVFTLNIRGTRKLMASRKR